MYPKKCALIRREERGGGINDGSASGSGSAVLGETSSVPPPFVNLATIPLLQLEWEKVLTPQGTKYKNGDFVIRENDTLQLAPNSVNSTNIAHHTIRSEDIHDGAITSRTIENHTIQGQDVNPETTLTIGSLTVTGTTTFLGAQTASGDLDMQGNIITNIGDTGTDFTSTGGLNLAGSFDVNNLFHVASSGDLTQIKGVSYSFPSSQGGANTLLRNDGTGTLSWATIGSASVTPDSLDFSELIDAMTLDASTSIALGSLTLSTSGTGPVSFNNTGVFTVAGNIDFNGTSNDIAGALNLSGNALTSSGALTVTPAAGNNLNIALSTTGDFAVNTNQLYVDTSAGNVGIGDSTPTNKLDVAGAIGISDTTVIDASRNLVNIGSITSGLINGQTISSAANFTGTVNAVTGYQANGLAPLGNVLRGDGTNFISATLSGGDITGAALTKTDDTNVTLTLGGTPATSLLRAASLTLGWTGQLGLTRGGTAASLIASNGGIVYSTASALAILSGTSTAGQMLQSGASGAPSWSTPTYPALSGTAGKILRSDGTNNVYTTSTFADTYTASNLLYSNGANTVTGLATVNSGVLVTSATGVPSLLGSMTNGQLVIGFTGAIPVLATITGTTDQIVVTNGAGSITLSTPQSINTTSTPQFARLGVGVAADATNILTATSASTANLSKTLNITHTGAVSGTGYSGYFSKTGASTTNVGLYTIATGATNNYSLQVDSPAATAGTYSIYASGLAQNFFAGNVGIGDTTPDGLLDVEPTGAVTTASYGINLSNLTTNSTTDAINKYGAYITSTGTWTGSSGTATNNYGLYVDTVSGGDNNYGAYIAGNVGIGTTGPGYKLDVNGTIGNSSGALSFAAGGTNQNISFTPSGSGTTLFTSAVTSAGSFTLNDTGTDSTAIRFQSSGTAKAFIGVANGANALVGGSAAGDFVIRTQATSQKIFFDVDAGGTPMMTLNNGNVGIGTTGPTSKLQVAGNVEVGYLGEGADRNITIWSSNVSNKRGVISHNGSSLILDGSIGNQTLLLGSGASTVFNQVNINSNGNSGNPFTINVAGNAKLSMDTTGNVGIGDTTPDGLLDVEPTGAVTTASYGINLSNLTTNSTTDAINKYGAYITSTGTWTGSSGTATNNYGLYVDTVSGGDNNYGAYIAGNVGIGTTGPAETLDVVGSGAFSTRLGVGIASNSGVGLRVHSDQVRGILLTNTTDGNTTSDGTYFQTNAGNFAIINQESGYLRFYTNGADVMRITNTGNVGIGTTTPGAKLNVIADSVSDYATELFNDGNATTRWGLLVQSGLDDQTAAGPSTLVQFNDGDGTAVGSITFGSSVTNYNTSSDVRLKQNIVDSELGLNDLMRIQVRDYTWRADESNRIAHGFIAQELYNIYPDAVTVPKDDRFWMVDYSKLTPLIVKSIQDQQGEIALQKGTLDTISLQTATNITTLGELQASVDTELLVISGSVNTLHDGLTTQGEAMKALKKAFTEQSDRITALEEAGQSDTSLQSAFDTLSSHTTLLDGKMETLTDQMASLADFYATFTLGNVLVKDSEGNLSLGEGSLTAKKVSGDAGLFKKITIETGSDADAIVGKNTIQAGETKIIIETTAVEKGSNILVTAREAFDGSLAVTDVASGKSFTVETAKPVEKDIPFTWLIVGQKEAK